MTDETLVRRGIELARRGNTLAWEWARWAWEAGGPIGEGRSNTGAQKQIASAR